MTAAAAPGDTPDAGPGAGSIGPPADGQPVGRLSPQPWMAWPETRAVIAALTAAGGEVRFAGGCVRDAVARRPVHDIDIATTEPPETVLVRLRDAAIRAVPTGIGHGTVTAVLGERSFEVTTLRIDVETDGRHATVAFTDDWVADAARRDLTINALSCTLDGAVFDYFHGLDDLALGRIRFVGRAADRIAEDRLRILRFFRFFAHYGRLPVDADALAACRDQAAGLSGLSGERVRVELLKTLAAPAPAETIRLMADHAVLPALLPEADMAAIGRLRMLAWLESRALPPGTVAAEPVRRLAALIRSADGRTDPAEAVADRLRLANRDRDRLLAAVDAAAAARWPAGPDAGATEVRRALYHRGADAVRDRLLLDWADELAVEPLQPRPRTEAWIGCLQQASGWTPPEFPLKGRDALAAGLAHGPAVGAILAEVAAWWEARDFRPDREACLAQLQTLADRR